MVAKFESAEARHARWLAAFEAIPKGTLTIGLPLEAAVALVGTLQLALRHPGLAARPSAKIVRSIIDTSIASLAGMAPDSQSVRDWLEAGNQPAYDEPNAIPGFCTYCHEQICDDAREPGLALKATRAHLLHCPKHPLPGLIAAAERAAGYLGRLMRTCTELDRGECQASIDELLAAIVGCSGEISLQGG